MTKPVNDAESEHFPLTLTQPLGHTVSRDAELVEPPKGPTYLLEHSFRDSASSEPHVDSLHGH